MTTKKEALLKLVDKVDDTSNMIVLECFLDEHCWAMSLDVVGIDGHPQSLREHYDPPRKPVPEGEWALVWEDEEGLATPLMSTGRIGGDKLICYTDCLSRNLTSLYKNWKHMVVKND